MTVYEDTKLTILYVLEMAATRKESWDTGGMTFYQPAVGIGGAEAEDVWDDGAILKAFDDALSTHSRKPGAETRKWKKHSIQAAGGQAPLRGMATHPMGAGYGSHGFQQPESRFASLLAKGNTEGAASRRAAGIPGPWEPVSRESEGSHRGMHQHDAGQRYDSGRGGGYDYSYYRGEEYGTHHNPYLNGSNMPSNGNVGGFEEGWERPGVPPPPAPPLPNGGLGPHSAAHQSLEAVLDDDLADLLLAWYYSGYYTGRYWAIQEARTPRFRRRYPPMGPPMTQGAPASSTAHFGAESWERQGWHQQAAPAPGQSPASRNAGKRPGP